MIKPGAIWKSCKGSMVSIVEPFDERCLLCFSVVGCGWGFCCLGDGIGNFDGFIGGGIKCFQSWWKVSGVVVGRGFATESSMAC